MRNSRRFFGFTLVEILVVITILAILFATLLPAITRVISRSRQSACKQNLRQIGIALKNYQLDFGAGTLFPDADGSPFVIRVYTTGFYSLKESNIFICPETIDDNQEGLLLNAVTTGDAQNAVSYAGRKNADQANYPGIFKPDKDNSTTPMVADDWDQPATTIDSDRSNHFDMCNFLFLDFHVDEQLTIETFTFNDLFDPLTN